MKLNEMTTKKPAQLKRALKEHFSLDVKTLERMPLGKTQKMLGKVRGLLREAQSKAGSAALQREGSYMKLVMLEQFLNQQAKSIARQHRIMFENEEVQKSQVILAAQDIIDQIQKMVESISKLKVEELPAVVTGVNNEIGSNEGSQFEQSATDALSALEAALGEAKSGLTSAMGIITGESAPALAPQSAELPDEMDDADLNDGGDDDLSAVGDDGAGRLRR